MRKGVLCPPPPLNMRPLTVLPQSQIKIAPRSLHFLTQFPLGLAAFYPVYCARLLVAPTQPMTSSIAGFCLSEINNYPDALASFVVIPKSIK